MVDHFSVVVCNVNVLPDATLSFSCWLTFFHNHICSVFYVDTEKNKDISRMEPASKDASTNLSSRTANKSTQNLSGNNNAKR